MKTLKRVFIIVLSALVILPTGLAFADDETDEYIKNTDKALSDVLPDEAQKYLSDNDISLEKAENVNKLSVSYWLSLIKDLMLENIKSPIKLLGEILIAILSLALIKSLLDDDSETMSLLGVVGTLITVGILYTSLADCITLVTDTITGASVFMYSYVPIFSSILAAGGSSSSGISYYVVTLAVCELIGFFVKNLLVPFLGFTIAVSIAEAINPSILGFNLSGTLKNISIWILGLIATIFIGVISVQGIMGTAADSLGLRTVKFAASSLIPIVGGAMSDAYSTFSGSISFLRSGVGAVGIAVILFTVLSPVITVLCLKIVFSICKGLSAFFGQSSIAGLLSGVNSVLTIILGVLACFTVVFIIATAVMMLISMNMV